MEHAWTLSRDGKTLTFSSALPDLSSTVADAVTCIARILAKQAVQRQRDMYRRQWQYNQFVSAIDPLPDPQDAEEDTDYTMVVYDEPEVKEVDAKDGNSASAAGFHTDDDSGNDMADISDATLNEYREANFVAAEAELRASAPASSFGRVRRNSAVKASGLLFH